MTATFKDLQEKEWSIRLDAPLVRRIHERLGINLTDLKADPFFKLATDPLLLAATMYLLCEKQANADGVSPDEFGERLGDRIDDATAAMEEAVINFSHSSLKSSRMSLLQESRDHHREAMETAIQELKTNRPEIQKMVAKATKARLTKYLENFISENGEGDNSAT